MNTATAILSARGIERVYRMGSQTLHVLRGVDLDLGEGEMLSIVGQSGSGKSTLLHQVGLLDKPDAGDVKFRGETLPLRGPRAAAIRNKLFGFVFQFYHLLPEFTALENVMMPRMIAEGWVSYRRQKREIRERAASLLGRVGLTERMKHRPNQLSGGERQRVAVARALVLEPKLLLADEPTGNLDPKTADQVLDLLLEMNRVHGTALVVVTHSPELATRLGRRVVLVDGYLEEPGATPTPPLA